jgi:putative transposase
MNYRRAIVPGGTFFFTVVTYYRQKLFDSNENIDLLREAFRFVMQNHPFKIVAIVVLPDHIHCIWTLPEDDGDYPTRWRLIKNHFSHHFTLEPEFTLSNSQKSKGEKAIWQRRYWEHLIRDEDDLRKHVEYIHYNPVKHGLVKSPVDWLYSSFHQYVRQGLYSADWGADEVMWKDMKVKGE